ncbi:MAG: type I-U CRISPR-associated helicase/endonuclease Cas3 [Rhodospirillales bacterium]|nr:MAG: type I-U CRISPR-associated helicase/endonuclease Cas3 [Rhodospirillales bacterium]
MDDGERGLGTAAGRSAAVALMTIPGSDSGQDGAGSPNVFDDAFRILTGHPPLTWQKRLFKQHFLGNDIPTACDLPTGLGKTSVMAIWLIARSFGSAVPRRLVYVVDRRAVVDQATRFAEQLRDHAPTALGIETLPISTLRGQFADNRLWLEDPAASAIIVGTVDMIGSRLLFSGYGVSPRMRPYHAGLLGADALVVLDESHLVPPFERLLQAIEAGSDQFGARARADRQMLPRFRLLALSATGRAGTGEVFRLNNADLDDAVVQQRLNARKRLSICEQKDGKLEDVLASAAWDLSDKGTRPVRVLVYCNSRDVAEKAKKAIEDTASRAKVDVETELFVGARRVKERVDAAGRLTDLGFLAGSEQARRQSEKPAFVIATSAGEVGVDLDADHMVCDLVPWERMVQRFGRVNRLGQGDARVVLVQGNKREPKKPDDVKPEERNAIIAWRSLAVLERLPADDTSIDVSPGALRDLKLRAADNPYLRQKIDTATTPDPLYPALTRALVDAWSMTSLKEHTGRPEVEPWLRGWIENEPQTTVVWRKYLPVRSDGGSTTAAEMRAFFAAARPHLAETLETETFRVVAWLGARAKWLAAKGHAGGEETEGTQDLPALSKDTVVCVVLDRAGDPKTYTPRHLLDAAKDKKAFERMLNGATVVVDARLRGLSAGLLDEKASDLAVPVADGEDGWRNGGADPLVPFRVRRVILGEDEDSGAGKQPAAREWQPIYAFDAAGSAEGEPKIQLLVEKWHGEAPNEDSRSFATRSQDLREHQDWTRQKAETLVAALGLDAALGKAVVLAARLHDEGKKAPRWQDAFRTPPDGRPYAKSGSRRPPDFDVLTGYRHEFGSLFHLERDNEFCALPDELKDLVRHLVVAHHGRARPLIGTEGCDKGPPTLLKAPARDVALRFARLQKRFGPWGLAWLEALVRAADQQASRDLDEGRAPDG